MKSIKAVLLTVVGIFTLFYFLAWAGEGEHPKMTKAQMKAEFSKCAVCKSMVPYMDKVWWGKTNHEVHNLKNGMILIESVADKKDVQEYQTMCSAMHTAIEEVKKMPEKKVQGKMCNLCQEMMALEKAGAQSEWVMTETGSLMVIIGQKPETVKQIHAMADKFRQM